MSRNLSRPSLLRARLGAGVRWLAARVADATTPRTRPLPLARMRGAAPAQAQAMVRALTEAVPMVDRVVLCRVLGRYKLLVDADDLGHAPHLLLDGFWEWGTTAWLLRELRPGDRFVDGGAAYGYFALLAADVVGPAGHVALYEPNPRLATLARASLALNGFAARAVVSGAALAFGVGTAPVRLLVPLRVPLGDPTGGVVPGVDLVQGRAAAPPGPRETLVPAVALDREAGAAPDVIKLDVPGSEEAAWRGVAPLFAGAPGLRVLLAFHPGRCRDPAALLNELAAIGPLRRLDPGGVERPVLPEQLHGPEESMLVIRRG